MDGQPFPVSPTDLYTRLGTASAPVLVDVRRDNTDDKLIIGAFHRRPDDVEHWLHDLPSGRQVVVYCGHGHEISQGIATTLRSAGISAAYLDGGISGWSGRLPTRKKIGAVDDRWVTREHPKIDRIACPWLISRFINPLAEFIYVPINDVPGVARERGAIPYDIKDAEFGHVGDQCSFDAIIRIYEIKDPALDHLARIVRGADTSDPAMRGPPRSFIWALGNYPDDHEMLRHGMVIYDALYTWCRLQVERQRSVSKAAS